MTNIKLKKTFDVMHQVTTEGVHEDKSIIEHENPPCDFHTETSEEIVDVDTLSSQDYCKLLSSILAEPIEDTLAFQVKYGLHDPNVFGFLEDDKMKVKIGHLVEELNEIKSSYEKKDLEEFCDGILDLVYVALGTLNLMNMPIAELWNDIQIRNMNKIRATADNLGKRGSTFDVIKGPGWTPPRTKDIIENAKNQKESH